ncbi:unnamed protein product [Caretta caretta]
MQALKAFSKAGSLVGYCNLLPVGNPSDYKSWMLFRKHGKYGIHDTCGLRYPIVQMGKGGIQTNAFSKQTMLSPQHAPLQNVTLVVF